MTAAALVLARSRLLLLLALGAGGVAGCWRGSSPPLTPPQRLVREVRQVLEREEPSARFYQQRGRLEAMGAELDPVLVALVNDPGADATVRANALLLLADRRASAALPVLRRVLLTADDETLRATAVLGLQRLAGESREAAQAIRAAISDPDTRVRLNVLQALDVEDVALIRALLRQEEDPRVRAVAHELVALAESRGAPLPRGPDGTYRTTVPEGEPQIVFQPTWNDSVAGVAVGALWVEVQRPRHRLIPLAQRVEVVGGVVPAFFSRGRTAVVYEAEREIRVRDLRRGEARVIGPGAAPRVIPFTDHFVFLEERPRTRRERDGGTELFYTVLRTSFTGGTAERLGDLRALARPERHAHASPVRWMVIGEAPEGFVLRGEGLSAFPLPSPFRGPAPARPPRRSPQD